MADSSDLFARLSRDWKRVQDASITVGTEIETSRVRSEHTKAPKAVSDRHVQSAIELLTTRIRNAAVCGWDGKCLTLSTESETQASGVRRVLPFVARAIFEVLGDALVDVDDIAVVVTPPASNTEADPRSVRARASTQAMDMPDSVPDFLGKLAVRAAAALKQSDRFWRRVGECHEFFSCNLNFMWPWRVLPKKKTGDGLRHPTNYWFGINGRVVQYIEGGLNVDGEPIGIPGHSFPFLLSIALITEYKYPQDKGTNAKERIICLGDTLVQVVRWLGYKCPRGREKEERFLERILQYCNCTHRIIVYKDKNAARVAYNEMVKNGCPPAPEKLGQRDGITKIIESFDVWDKAEIARDPITRRPFGFFKLSQRFAELFADRHSVPLHPAVVAQLLGNPQDLALYAWWTEKNWEIWDKKMKGKPWSGKIGVSALLDQIGNCRKKENKRPTTMIGLPVERRELNKDDEETGRSKGSLGRVRDAVGLVAVGLGRPECSMQYEVDRVDHAAIVDFTPVRPLRDGY